MTSIDELFQKSGVLNKRKLEPVRDPNELYKSAKRSGSGSSARRALVEAADDNENDDNDDSEAGPALPPADDGAEDVGDDDEGRFFGSGVSAAFNDIIEYIDEEDEGGGGGGGEGAAARTRREGVNEAPLEAEKYDRAWVRRTVLSFERRINRNAEQRARYATEPARFIESEAELDTQLKELSLLGEHPELYDEFVRLGAAASLVSLMAHENTDIAISAIEIIGELTDEDVDATDEQWNVLVDALLDADLIGLLVSNLARLDEDADEADRLGVYYAMGIVENLCSSRGSDGEEYKRTKQKEKRNGKNGEDSEEEKVDDVPGGTRAAMALGTDKALIAWLLQRASRRETRTGAPAVSQNRQYAAEILAILVQAAPTNRKQLLAQNGVDAMLQLVAPYRRRDPEKGSDEEEFMEDLFEALTCLVDEAEGKKQFAEAEGVELCLLLLQDGKKSRMPALRLLDHAAGGAALEVAADVCRRIVEAGGLKALFTLFMRGDEHHKDKKHKKDKKDKKDKKTTLHGGPIAEHLLGIMASMLRLLPAESAERIRLLAKFVEKDYAKVEQLMALRREYGTRVATAEQQLAADAVDDEDERLARRLEAGLFTEQTIDVILAWLVAEDAGAQRKIRAALAERDETLATLRTSLQERRDGIDPEVADGQDMREMLETLMVFLE